MRDLRSWLARTPLGRLLPADRERHAADRLSALLDDELSDDEALEVSRHVVRCGDCARELEEIRRCREVVRALPRVDPPRELYAAAPPGTGASVPRRGRRLAVAVGLSGAVLGVVAFAAGGEQGETVTPEVERYVVDHVARTDGGPVPSPVDLGR